MHGRQQREGESHHRRIVVVRKSGCGGQHMRSVPLSTTRNSLADGGGDSSLISTVITIISSDSFCKVLCVSFESQFRNSTFDTLRFFPVSMAKSTSSSRRKRHTKEDEEKYDDASTSSPQSSSSEEDDDNKRSHKCCRGDDRGPRKSSSRKDRKSSSRRKRKEKERRSKHKSKEYERRKKDKYYLDEFEVAESLPRSDGDDDDSGLENPEDVVKCILKEFPAVSRDLEQLLHMIDDGQAVDIRGLSEKTLVKHLRRLFLCLNLKETGDNIFLLISEGHPTLEVCRPVIHGYGQSSKQQLDHCTLENELLSVSPDGRNGPDANMTKSSEGAIGPRRRVIGPEMPSAELLAAAAKLTEAEAELRASSPRFCF